MTLLLSLFVSQRAMFLMKNFQLFPAENVKIQQVEGRQSLETQKSLRKLYDFFFRLRRIEADLGRGRQSDAIARDKKFFTTALLTPFELT
jgi:hypothetical protein